MAKKLTKSVCDFIYYNIYLPSATSIKDFFYTNLRHDNLMFKGTALERFYHHYNHTYTNERQIEIPIVNLLIQPYLKGSILEIGNVLSHYFDFDHTIIDKYEQGVKVINIDICDYKPSTKYDCIFSISTFEHIGFDYGEPSDDDKVLKSIESVMEMLHAGGKFILTMPLGYNPNIDRLVKESLVEFDEQYFYKRIGDDWVLIKKDQMEYIYGMKTETTRELFIGIKYRPN
jgi:hypothetical protein